MMLQEAATASVLSAWESFYVIVGSSGAALTGLQFVVIALVHDLHAPTSSDTIDAFATPTVVHFSLVLRRHAAEALFTVGAATVLLLFVGIHNAWDTVTYLTLTPPERSATPQPAEPEPSLTGSLPDA